MFVFIGVLLVALGCYQFVGALAAVSPIVLIALIAPFALFKWWLEEDVFPRLKDRDRRKEERQRTLDRIGSLGERGSRVDENGIPWLE